MPCLVLVNQQYCACSMLLPTSGSLMVHFWHIAWPPTYHTVEYVSCSQYGCTYCLFTTSLDFSVVCGFFHPPVGTPYAQNQVLQLRVSSVRRKLLQYSFYLFQGDDLQAYTIFQFNSRCHHFLFCSLWLHTRGVTSCAETVDHIFIQCQNAVYLWQCASSAAAVSKKNLSECIKFVAVAVAVPFTRYTTAKATLALVCRTSRKNLSNQLLLCLVSFGNSIRFDGKLISKQMCISNMKASPLVVFLWLIAWSANLVTWHSHCHINLAISSRVLVATGSILVQPSQRSYIGMGISEAPPTHLAFTTVQDQVFVVFNSGFALTSSIAAQKTLHYSRIKGYLQDSLHYNCVEDGLQLLLLTGTAQGMIEQQHATINSTARNNVDDTEPISVFRAWQALVLITLSSIQLLTFCSMACQVVLIHILYKLLHTMRRHKHYGGFHSEGLIQSLWIRAPQCCSHGGFISRDIKAISFTSAGHAEGAKPLISSVSINSTSAVAGFQQLECTLMLLWESPARIFEILDPYCCSQLFSLVDFPLLFTAGSRAYQNFL